MISRLIGFGLIFCFGIQCRSIQRSSIRSAGDDRGGLAFRFEDSPAQPKLISPGTKPKVSDETLSSLASEAKNALTNGEGGAAVLSSSKEAVSTASVAALPTCIADHRCGSDNAIMAEMKEGPLKMGAHSDLEVQSVTSEDSALSFTTKQKIGNFGPVYASSDTSEGKTRSFGTEWKIGFRATVKSINETKMKGDGFNMRLQPVAMCLFWVSSYASDLLVKENTTSGGVEFSNIIRIEGSVRGDKSKSYQVVANHKSYGDYFYIKETDTIESILNDCIKVFYMVDPNDSSRGIRRALLQDNAYTLKFVLENMEKNTLGGADKCARGATDGDAIDINGGNDMQGNDLKFTCQKATYTITPEKGMTVNGKIHQTLTNALDDGIRKVDRAIRKAEHKKTPKVKWFEYTCQFGPDGVLKGQPAIKAPQDLEENLLGEGNAFVKAACDEMWETYRPWAVQAYPADGAAPAVAPEPRPVQ